jgi:hypothetical protein
MQFYFPGIVTMVYNTSILPLIATVLVLPLWILKRVKPGYDIGRTS